MPRLYDWIYFKRWGRIRKGIIVKLCNDGALIVYEPFEIGFNGKLVSTIFRGEKFAVVFREGVVKWFEEN